MNFLLTLIFILWVAVVLKDIFFWTYFWQTKEYRIDRMRAHFELPTGRKLLLNKRNTLLAFLFVASFMPINAVQFVIALAVLFIYLFFALRIAKQIQNKSLRFPKATMRTLVILGISFVTYTAITFFVFLNLNSFLLSWLILGYLSVPAFIFLGALATLPLSNRAKSIAIKRATKKATGFKDLLVIGITGSYGKSSMKEILSQILKTNFKVLKTPSNVNTDIGVANLIQKKLKSDHEVFIVEMGAYKKGEIKKTAQMARPQMGIITGINPQHISLFGSLQQIQEAKYELIEELPDNGLAIFNGDSENTMALFRKCDKGKRLYSTHDVGANGAQKIFVKDIKTTHNGQEINVVENSKDDSDVITLKTNLLGKHNALNILGAVTVAREIGMSWDDIANAVLELSPPKHTLQTKKGIKGSVVVDDAYAANEDGVIAALDVLKNMEGNKKICILQPLIELGDSAERVHKKIAEKLGESCDVVILTSRDYFNLIYKEALDAGIGKDSIFCLPRPQEALRKIQEITDKGDVILVENRVPEVVLKGVILHNK